MPSVQPSSALYIGRFQPFHLGHLDAIQQILAKEEHVIIGIGSAEDSFLPENPFTAGERYQMVAAALKEAGISCDRFAIIPIRNINNYSLWVSHVELYCPPFDTVYSGSKIVKELFEKHGGHKFLPITLKRKLSATMVRELIAKGRRWQEYVPKSVAALIENFKGVERIKNIQGS